MNHALFFQGYLSAVLSSLGPQAEGLDLNNIYPSALVKMQRDCRDFCTATKSVLPITKLEESRAGALFWINRNKGNVIFSDECARTNAAGRALITCTRTSYHFGPVPIYVQEGRIYTK
jgi:hypothetical protein